MPSAPILLTIETNTYAAYNCVGGKCLFPYLSTDRSHSNLVSFERPLQPDFMGGFHAWDQFFTSWLDAEGYQVDYCVNADHDRQPDLLDDYPAHLRICHGEYTSREECEQLQRFVARGGNLMVFAGNSFSHLVETRAGGRQLYCPKSRYKEHPLGTPETPRHPFSGQSTICVSAPSAFPIRLPSTPRARLPARSLPRPPGSTGSTA